MLASLEGQLLLGLARGAFESEDNLLGRLGLLVENRLGLTTVTGLLAVVSTLTLRESRSLARLYFDHPKLEIILLLSLAPFPFSPILPLFPFDLFIIAR